ncbi:SUMO1 sentrin specific peptidase 7 L homeolog isoform X1 [Pelobates cultripes]|nr:SUMO1 sentrin specific peptidase 7 L homeolog isoform X1 [Pelobates cultripes]CAH2223083.1 SUMO1 sentrin specific peptidase 7 L homeolog isoform X1 [Pelobates cultripes]CAH2223084.1 SUMO1 sentrin specific peptidase 7 L homeolog isoform X1 [Pelobates cultripes]
MMDKQKKALQTYALVTEKPPTFRIPKKKDESWSEDVPQNSPLSDFRNVTTRKKTCSSYNLFNKTRNKESCEYYTSKCGSHSSSRPETHMLSCSIGPLKKRSPPYNMCPEKRLSVERKDEVMLESPPSKACQDVSNKPVSPRKDANVWGNKTRNPDQGIQSPQELSILECKDHLKKATTRKVKHEKNDCDKQTEELISVGNNSKETSSQRDPAAQVKACPKRFKNTSTDRPSLGTPRVDGDSERPCKRKLHLKHCSNESSSSSEPIVLSSDEEASSKKNAFPVPYRSPPSETAVTQESSKKGTELNNKAECSVMEIKYMYVYFGNKKARSTGCVKFSHKSITIPLKGVCLTVDTSKLLRYGLWVKNGGDSLGGQAIIFLWVDKDHAQSLNKQTEANTNILTAKTTEFIFLELNNIPTKSEQVQLVEIMKRASKHGSSSLAHIFSWDDAYPMLKELCPEENSFMSSCFFDFQMTRRQDHHLSPRSVPERDVDTEQNPKGVKEKPAEKPAPSYSLLHRSQNGRLSFSLTPKQDHSWRPMQNGGSLQKLLVYPPPPTKGGLGVTNEDLECLEHGEFLNDVIIDFYLKFLLLEKFPRVFAEKCHIFSSFFFKCLTRKDVGLDDNKTTLTSAQRRHQRVKTWTRHIDLFSKDFVFVPVNENSHWYLVVICFPGLEKAVYEDSDKPISTTLQSQETRIPSSSTSVIVLNDRIIKEYEHSSDAKGSHCQSPSKTSIPSVKCKQTTERNRFRKILKRPCFLIFDSLTTPSVPSTIHVLREYLRVEWDMKKTSPREFNSLNFIAIHPKVPKQDNSTDCGLYLLQYVESFFLKPIDNFDHPMHLEEWFPLSVVKNKREEIRDLILQLHLKQMS